MIPAYQACIDRAAYAYHVPAVAIETVISSPHATGAVGVMGLPPTWLPVLARYGFDASRLVTDNCDNIFAGAWILAVNPESRVDPTLSGHQGSPGTPNLPNCAMQAAAEYKVTPEAVEAVLAAPHPAGSIGPMGIPALWMPLLVSSGFNGDLVRQEPCMGIAAGIWILGVEQFQGYISQGAGAPTLKFSPMPPAWLIPIAEKAAIRYSLPVDLIFAICAQESGFKPWVTSSAGAEGLMQLMPATAATYSVVDPYDPEQSVMGGAAYLASLRSEFDGNIPLMLAAYNAGSQAVHNYGDHIPPFQETVAYVPDVLARLAIYKNYPLGKIPR